MCIFQRAVSLIWDIVQSVEKRGSVPLRQQGTSVSSRRELLFSAESESLPQEQHTSDSSADCKKQPHLATNVDAAATASDMSNSEKTASADNDAEKQTSRGLQEVDKGAGEREKTVMQQQQSTMNEVSQCETSPKAEKQSGKNGNTKYSVQAEHVIAPDNITSSSGTRGEKASASISTDESKVSASSATADTVKDVSNNND